MSISNISWARKPSNNSIIEMTNPSKASFFMMMSIDN
jgi:hypothetical protein